MLSTTPRTPFSLHVITSWDLGIWSNRKRRRCHSRVLINHHISYRRRGFSRPLQERAKLLLYCRCPQGQWLFCELTEATTPLHLAKLALNGNCCQPCIVGKTHLMVVTSTMRYLRWTTLLFFLTVVYIFSHLYIYLEDIISLRSQPEKVFLANNQFFPFI